MKLAKKKKIAGKVLGVSPNKIRLDLSRKEEILEAITKTDIRHLIGSKAIKRKKIAGASKVRARKRKIQKKKGRRRGEGKRKGTQKARNPKKRVWINKIRVLRKFLKDLRDKKLITQRTYQTLYKKAKGGFFRNRRHLKLYIEENKLFIKK